MRGTAMSDRHAPLDKNGKQITMNDTLENVISGVRVTLVAMNEGWAWVKEPTGTHYLIVTSQGWKIVPPKPTVWVLRGRYNRGNQDYICAYVHTNGSAELVYRGTDGLLYVSHRPAMDINLFEFVNTQP